MIRITRENLFMQCALLFAKRSACQRLQTGCVVTQTNRIVSTGYNGPIGGELDCEDVCIDTSKPCTKAIHAEANAIYFAANHGIELMGATLYCTHSPCVKCAEAIIQSGIKKVYFAERFRDMTGLDILYKANIFYQKI